MFEFSVVLEYKGIYRGVFEGTAQANTRVLLRGHHALHQAIQLNGEVAFRPPLCHWHGRERAVYDVNCGFGHQRIQ